MVDDETTVWVASTERKAVHTDRDCHHLERTTTEPTPYDRGEFPQLPLCRDCSGERTVSKDNPWKYHTRLSDLSPEDVGLSPLTE